MAHRTQGFQNIAWFRDLHTRGLLDMNPPYQRRSVWTDRYQEDFIDTILLDYPAPAIFLYERIGADEQPNYSVVDGKQRLTAIFEFVANKFAVGDSSPLASYRGVYYNNLPLEVKQVFLRYRFSVEYLPSENETEINNIFDRLNRNVKKLTAQELRHAKYDGVFITATESLSEWLELQLTREVPRIAVASRRQMKDVEIVATLLLFLEGGPKGYSIAALDEAFASRDATWDRGHEWIDEFKAIITFIGEVVRSIDGQSLIASRLRNQADFYSLFAAVAELRREGATLNVVHTAIHLKQFVDILEQSPLPGRASDYYEAARSASNATGPRRTRINVMKDVLLGRSLERSNGPAGS